MKPGVRAVPIKPSSASEAAQVMPAPNIFGRRKLARLHLHHQKFKVSFQDFGLLSFIVFPTYGTNCGTPDADMRNPGVKLHLNMAIHQHNSEPAKVKPGQPPKRTLIEPLKRALSLLEAFGPRHRWLSNADLVSLTGLPASTVTRQTQCLVELGYLRHVRTARKYCLDASVLALGYAAYAHTRVQMLSSQRMRALAEKHSVQAILCTRDRLELLIVESVASASATWPVAMHVGGRFELGSTPMGWALLAALPDVERYYLLERVEKHRGRDWPILRKRSSEAISQVMNMGYCMSVGESGAYLGIAAAPLIVSGHAPLAIACLGPANYMSRARVERAIGPELVGAVTWIQEQSENEA